MIKEILEKDLKNAIQKGWSHEKNVIRQLYVRINKFEKENDIIVTEEVLLGLISKELKEVYATAEHAKGNLAIACEDQILYLMKFDIYRPKAMNVKEIEDYLLDVLDTSGMERSMKSMKYLITIFKERNPGQDMKIVSGIIKKVLTS